MRRSFLTLVTALAVIGCQSGPETASETAPPAGGAASATATATMSPSEERLATYVQARRQLESQYPELRAALQSGGPLAQEHRERLEPALGGGPFTVEEFLATHEQVQSDPSLRARVEAALDEQPGAGTSGAGGTEPGWRGSPADQPPTSGGTGAAPAPSPQ